jgi:hypothetical protein
MTPSEVLTEIQYGVIENAAFSSGLWTLAEVLTYMELRQQRFLKATRVTAAVAIIPWVPGQPEAPLPIDHIDSICARWHSFADEQWFPIPQSDAFELDHVSPDTALTVHPPQGFRLSDLETLRIALGPAPTAPGELELVYVALAESILADTSIPFEVPDALGPYLKYGVLADMLAKEGRGQDLLRARYCEQRWEEGVALASSLLDGWA